jgi:hypothetical protein
MSNERTEHRHVGERLSAYLDGELLPQERAAVHRHLARCRSCQWELHTLRQTVQWTRELPVVPIPRVFTLPVPAKPVRASRRRWSFVPLLQGATALVALLLVFVVAGDWMLSGSPFSAVPGRAVVGEQAPVEVQMTVLVEQVQEIPAAAEMEVVVEKESEVVAEKAITEPTRAPAPAQALPGEPPSAGGAEAATATPGVLGTPVAEPVGEEGVEDSATVGAAEAPRAPAPEATASEADTAAMRVGVTPTLPLLAAPGATAVETESAVVEAEPSATAYGAPTPAPVVEETPVAGSPAEAMPTALPTPAREAAAGEAGGERTQALVPSALPPEAPAPALPTTVAEVREEAWSLEAEEGQRPAAALRLPAVAWLRVAESALGTTLVLLGVTTVVVMILRRRDC